MGLIDFDTCNSADALPESDSGNNVRPRLLRVGNLLDCVFPLEDTFHFGYT